MDPKAKAVQSTVSTSERVVALAQELGGRISAHPVVFAIFIAAVLLLGWLTRKHFKGTYGPHIWALKPERNKFLRGLVHVLVVPLRLLAALFSGLVVLVVIALLAGLGYAIWKVATQH